MILIGIKYNERAYQQWGYQILESSSILFCLFPPASLAAWSLIVLLQNSPPTQLPVIIFVPKYEKIIQERRVMEPQGNLSGDIIVMKTATLENKVSILPRRAVDLSVQHCLFRQPAFCNRFLSYEVRDLGPYNMHI